MSAEDKAYRDWVHRQPCVGLEAFPGVCGHFCGPPPYPVKVQQSHARDMTGVGRKEPEKRSVAMCPRLHQRWEEHNGWFNGWTKKQRRDWMNARIAEANAKFDKEQQERLIRGETSGKG